MSQEPFVLDLTENIAEVPARKKPKTVRSKICEHFTWIEETQRYRCNYCKRTFSIPKGGGNGNLNNHVKLKHPALRSEIDKAAIQSASGGIKFLPQEKKLPQTVTKEGFKEKLVKFIISTDQPFSIVEDEAFKQLIEYCSRDNPITKLPGRTTTRDDILKKFEDERNKIKIELSENTSMFSFIIDCWTSSNQNPFLGIVITWVDNEWNLQTRVLDLNILKGSHTGTNLAESFISTIEDFGIQKKLLAITGDNAKNIDTMCKEIETYAKASSTPFRSNAHRIRCFAHILNLATQAILKPFDEPDDDETTMPSKALSKLRKIVSSIRSSPQRREIFHAQCSSTGITPKCLILDVRTRWNSTLSMIERALEYKEVIDVTTNIIKKLRQLLLDDEDWELLKDLIQILHPFKEATTIISTESSPTLSKVTGMYQALLDMLEAAIDKYEDTSVGKAAAEGREKLLSYYTICDGASYIVATVLDPRYTVKWYIDKKWRNEWVAHCKRTIKEEFKAYKLSTDSNEESSQSQGEVVAPISIFDQIDFPTNLPIQEDELKRYLSLPRVNPRLLDRDVNGALGWWKIHQTEFPQLAKMARDFLPIAGSGVAVERLFSSGPDILSHRRQQLNDESIRMSICLKNWLRLDG